MFYTKGKGRVTLPLPITTHPGYERFAWCFSFPEAIKPTSHFFESGIHSLLWRNRGERGGDPAVDTLFLKLNVSG